ncbi:MAG: DUF1801 domain-containing protein [Pseudomonadota bacterium]
MTAKKTAKKTAAGSATKKAAARARTTPRSADVSAFIDAVENDTRRRDAKTLLQIMKDVTGEAPVMWGGSIIGFGGYHYKYDSGREGDSLNVGFSPRKANLVLYVMGSIADDDPLRDKLGKYKTGKACLYVNKLDDVDLDVLRRLIRKSYEATIAKWGAPAG